jgi:hypothetical protein
MCRRRLGATVSHRRERVNDTEIEVELDSGADVNVIDNCTRQNLKENYLPQTKLG